jgi:hypothetical protein
MFDMLKDKKFLIGAVVGTLVGPYALKTAQGLLGRLKAKAAG